MKGQKIENAGSLPEDVGELGIVELVLRSRGIKSSERVPSYHKGIEILLGHLGVKGIEIPKRLARFKSLIGRYSDNYAAFDADDFVSDVFYALAFLKNQDAVFVQKLRTKRMSFSKVDKTHHAVSLFLKLMELVGQKVVVKSKEDCLNKTLDLLQEIFETLGVPLSRIWESPQEALEKAIQRRRKQEKARLCFSDDHYTLTVYSKNESSDLRAISLNPDPRR